MSDSIRLCQAYCWQHSLIAGRNDSERCYTMYLLKVTKHDTIFFIGKHCGFSSRHDLYPSSDLSCKGPLNHIDIG